MRKFIIALSLALVGMLGFAAPASATQNDDTTKTVVWEMPGWNGNQPVWPQKYVASATNVGLDISIEADCGYFQVDVYKYEKEGDIAKVDALIAGGVLTGPSQPLPEPLIPGGLGTAWKFVNLGECGDDEPTPDPTPTETEPTPDPTPTETTPEPTPTETETTPAPTPTESTPTSTPTESTPAAAPPTLPRTGSNTPLLALAGALAVAIGAGALALTRKPGLHE